MFFGITLIVFAIIGGLRVSNQDTLTQELKRIKGESIILKNIISDLNYSGVLDSTQSYDQFITGFFSSQNLGFPDLAPVEGYITRGLHMENNHLGVDIAAKNQDDVRAPADGRVMFSGTSEDLGNTIIINHPGGFITVFGHNDTNLVNAGEELQKGQVVARVGETGKSQGPHLHFEIWKNNQVLDPREIIAIYKEKDVSIRQTR